MWTREKKKLSFRQFIKYIRLLCFIIVAIIVFLFVKEKMFSRESKPEIISKSTLEKVINVSDLSTFEAIYNGIATVANEEKPENIDYYVSYEAKVKAGIDFEKVNLEVNEDVDIASLDYIFMNKRANTETVSAQAYKKCIEDVTNESNSTTAIYELAKQNAHNIVEALIKPFVEQLDSKYELKIN